MPELNGKYQVKTMGVEEYQALTACQNACPVGTDTKRYVRAITEGDYRKAYLIARQSNPLVSVCSRVCTAPCEKSCRKSDDGAPVDIRALKRFVCDQNGVAAPRSVAESLDGFALREGPVSDRTGNHILTISRLPQAADGKRVAIVGSGPAGLSAAHDLALLDYRVTIFEAAPQPGGQLITGIPGFRLPKEIVQQEIEAILELGVELKLNSPIGGEVTLEALRGQGFQATFVTIGLQAPLTIPLEGSSLRGVYHGIEYVRDYARMPVGKSCLVIGGGGVAIDCAQHALRQGAAKVRIACLESWEAMPASDSDKEDAKEEGIEFHTSLGPQRILGKDGRAIGIDFLKVASVFDAQGKFNPSFVPGSQEIIPADTVILAVGQASTLPHLFGMQGIEATPNGLIRAAEDLSTNLPGVFAGGDVRAGCGRNATEAIADGQKAARAIHGYLSGKAPRLRKKGYLRAVDPDFCNTRCETIPSREIPKREAGERVRTGKEITVGFDEEQAREQAARCRRCNIQPVYDGSRCILCGTCADTCVHQAIKLVRLSEIQGDEKVARLARDAGESRGRGKSAIIKDDSRCVSCGMCARRCPAGAITMAEFYCEEEWE